MVELKSQKPYLAVVFIMVVYAGNALVSKVAMAKGMNPFVFTVYRQAFACLTLAPLAYFCESGKGPALSLSVLCKIFFISLCGITASLDLYYKGMKYTSATFAAACTNAIPAITFVLAVLLRYPICHTFEKMSAHSCTSRGYEARRTEVIFCHHNLPAIVLTVHKDSVNQGKRFYRCPFWKENDCTFFEWIDKRLSEAMTIFPTREMKKDEGLYKKIVSEAQEDKEMLELKVAKLKKKKLLMGVELKRLTEDNAMLRAENLAHKYREKMIIRLCFVSWILILIVIVVGIYMLCNSKNE